MKVLFICTGNTCRSPMAEAIFNKYAQDYDKDYNAFSRGLSVFAAQPTNAKSMSALNDIGITNFTHTSTQLTPNDIESCDMVLTMTSVHKIILKNAFPKYKNKIFTLNEKAYGTDSDITDPYGKTQNEYNKCCLYIKGAVEQLICIL